MDSVNKCIRITATLFNTIAGIVSFSLLVTSAYVLGDKNKTDIKLHVWILVITSFIIILVILGFLAVQRESRLLARICSLIFFLLAVIQFIIKCFEPAESTGWVMDALLFVGFIIYFCLFLLFKKTLRNQV